jgi:prepilin-type N-terminal cleavage/methylation domain-containing protein
MNLLIRHKRRLRSIAGFTLIEMLVIIIIIGILFAIAAPGWDAFLSRQRVNTAREQVVQAVKQAQTTAKTSKVPQIIAFRTFPSTNGFPEFASGAYVEDTHKTQPPSNWQRLGENSFPAGSVEVKVKRLTPESTLVKDAIVFDASGTVEQYPLDQKFDSGGKEGFLKVTVGKSPLSTNSGSQRCVIVKTILGAIQQAEGTDCN